MALPNNINFDKIVMQVLADISKACESWMKGAPRDEVTLMSRLTENLTKKRRKCNVGVVTPIGMEADFHLLHRCGPNQVDQYGADLAVTVRIPSENWIKTCFFQFKVAENQQTSLNNSQLNQPTQFPGVDERSFVLAVEGSTAVFRLQKTKKCRDQISPPAASKAFDISRWRMLSDWLLRWFKCLEGKETGANDPNPVEALLRKYVIAARKGASAEQILKANLPDKMTPARAWLDVKFVPKEN